MDWRGRGGEGGLPQCARKTGGVRRGAPDVVGDDAVGHVDAVHVVLAHIASVWPHPRLGLRRARAGSAARRTPAAV